MAFSILDRVDQAIIRYKNEHQGNVPLFIALPADEADALRQAIKTKQGLAEDIIVTEYKGSKIVPHPALKKGEMQLLNELPETGS